jgi:hypothetical protein
MPSLDIDNIEIYQTLILRDVKEHGLEITEKTRTRDIFYGRERQGYIVVFYDNDGHTYGFINMFF